MSPWYVPSLLPILALSAALAGLILWRSPRNGPYAAYGLSLTAWTGSILLAADPTTQPLGDRTMMVGFFIPAAFLHVAARELGWRHGIVVGVYSLGVGMASSGAVAPHLYLSGGGMVPGPLFAPMLAATLLIGGLPLGLLWRTPDAAGTRERRRYLLLAGLTMAVGGVLAMGAMLTGTFYPIGVYLLMCSVGLMTYVAQASVLPTFSRFVERSQRYALMAALLSTLWMFLLLTVVQIGIGWTWEAALLLFVLTLTAQPLLTEARLGLTQVVFGGGRGDADGLTRALEDSEARAAQARRLAEVGIMASAVAHEVRNPLGVIRACVAVLERQGAETEVLDEIRAQVQRAALFADDLLEYGRPAPPRLRTVQLADVVDVAASEVHRALQRVTPLEVDMAGSAEVQADYSALVRLFGVLLENACLAGAHRIRVEITADPAGIAVSVDDDGDGIPEALADRVMAPFVSGRGREGPRPGTGLGLAIAAGIAERHQGHLRYAGRGGSGGARFALWLPRGTAAGEGS